MPNADHFVVRAKNTGDKDFPISHDGALLTVPAGGDLVVPWDAMASLWGDPAVVDTRAGSRHEQAMKHRGQFGWFHGLNPEETYVDPQGVRRDGWNDMAPPIEWYTLDGDRIWTVLDDPTGEKAAQGGWDRPQQPVGDVAYLQQQVERLQAQTDEMRRSLEQRNAAAQQADNQPARPDGDGELPKPDPDAKATKDDTPSQPRTGTKGR